MRRCRHASLPRELPLRFAIRHDFDAAFHACLLRRHVSSRHAELFAIFRCRLFAMPATLLIAADVPPPRDATPMPPLSRDIADFRYAADAAALYAIRQACFATGCCFRFSPILLMLRATPAMRLRC